MMSQKLNLLTYGIIWHIKKDKKNEKCTLSKNQPVGSNWRRDNIVLQWLHINPAKIDQDR